ncbi:hypothetical protein BKA82DRAFT_993435 [Pisolithus tinctorius]|nr:hypothetical protein BKA82DRAFT_993435 [Pisolithus tinctorius]
MLWFFAIFSPYGENASGVQAAAILGRMMQSKYIWEPCAVYHVRISLSSAVNTQYCGPNPCLAFTRSGQNGALPSK